MTEWSYTEEPDKDDIVIGTGHPTKGRAYDVGEEFSGIDCYIGAVIHEEKHVDQIARADQLVPAATGTTFRYGYSWNQAAHNHWDKGPDGQWGDSGTDDDNNDTIDDAKPTPNAKAPYFEPGNGDDGDIDNPAYRHWPNAWALPDPLNGLHQIEAEAVNASDNGLDENDYAESDWGNPGKQHATVDTWDD
jgi:hypothetical protein